MERQANDRQSLGTQIGDIVSPVYFTPYNEGYGCKDLVADHDDRVHAGRPLQSSVAMLCSLCFGHVGRMFLLYGFFVV